MPWLWTDDIARLLVERGLAGAGEIAVLETSPYAIHSPVDDSESVIRIGLAMLGREAESGAA